MWEALWIEQVAYDDDGLLSTTNRELLTDDGNPLQVDA